VRISRFRAQCRCSPAESAVRLNGFRGQCQRRIPFKYQRKQVTRATPSSPPRVLWLPVLPARTAGGYAHGFRSPHQGCRNAFPGRGIDPLPVVNIAAIESVLFRVCPTCGVGRGQFRRVATAGSQCDSGCSAAQKPIQRFISRGFFIHMAGRRDHRPLLTWWAPLPTLGLQIRVSLIQRGMARVSLPAVRFEST
jgi:hypothetical protein